MANYLLNLGVATSNLAGGSFETDSGNVNPLLRSCVWLQGGAALAPSNSFYQVPVAMIESEWSFLQETSSVLSVEAGDFMLVRIFQANIQTSPVPNLLFNAVFGQGSSSEAGGASTPLQSPLTENGSPRTVIDSFQLAFTNNPQLQQQYWSQPNSTDGAWTFCLGEISGEDNTYSFNAGALVCTNPSVGSPIYQYGLDPHVKVGMGLRRRREVAA
jgi:hypothetical protein